MQPVLRIRTLLTLAAVAPGSAEALEALRIAESVADTHRIDLFPLAVEAKVALPARLEWTNEPAPFMMSWKPRALIPLADGSLLEVADDLRGQGVMIHRLSREDYRTINRGFWPDHEITEALCFALEAWNCTVSADWKGWG